MSRLSAALTMTSAALRWCTLLWERMFEDDDDYDQDAHVARLEEENLTLKERLFLMVQEVGDMRRRLEALEACFLHNDAVGGVRQNPGNDGVHVSSENSGEDNAYSH
jgi:hypothetical protein